MVSVAEVELSELGIGPEQAATAARRIMSNFCKQHGGKIYRVPVLQCLTKPERDKAIREDAQHMSVRQLMRKYELAASTVREIIGSE